MKQEKIIISKDRVKDFAEVYTPLQERQEMINLVDLNASDFNSRILEPACGDGNFLHDILDKRLISLKKQKSQYNFDRLSFLAVSSLYGIDIISDNVEKCRSRLLNLYTQYHKKLFKIDSNPKIFSVVGYLLKKNIVKGNALTLKSDDGNKPIIFSQWSYIDENNIIREDFSFSEILDPAKLTDQSIVSDTGEDIFIPKPLKTYRPCNFLDIENYE